jgi:hypothetical protein
LQQPWPEFLNDSKDLKRKKFRLGGVFANEIANVLQMFMAKTRRVGVLELSLFNCGFYYFYVMATKHKHSNVFYTFYITLTCATRLPLFENTRSNNLVYHWFVVPRQTYNTDVVTDDHCSASYYEIQQVKHWKLIHYLDL